MLKFTIDIKENKGSDSCKVTIKTQNDLSKATDNEKNTGSAVFNAINEALQNLN